MTREYKFGKKRLAVVKEKVCSDYVIFKDLDPISQEACYTVAWMVSFKGDFVEWEYSRSGLTLEDACDYLGNVVGTSGKSMKEILGL